MITPIIHMNGTSGERLLEQQLKAIAALGAALVAMSDAYPNGRDYYTQGPQVVTGAMADHAARMDAVEAIREQYNQIAEAISDQMVTS
tara:strand:- start:339 stop:602 length:264 start_codon:yes stop_codon:yes gene_type:complete